MKLLLTTLLLTSVGAFAPPSSVMPQSTMIRTRQTKINPSSARCNMSSENNNQLADLQSKVQDLVSQINTDGLMSNLDTIKSNVLDGDVGSRGEVYAFAQLAILLCILGGGIPIVGGPLMVLLGPGLLLAGAGVIVIASNDLGASLSPWPVPSANPKLETGGLYAEMRHPMYGGLLAACAGLSIVSGSATRLLLTAVLWYGLDVKSDYEEEALMKAFPMEYATYQTLVTSKFFPASITEQLPWMNEDEVKGELESSD
jgi:protein-S-isoprenylcysteine O-methyltransferase Ste14